MSDEIRFDDGAAYERYMGVWSQLAADQFLDWLAPPPNLRWLDVGCGNGAFTQSIIDRCRPAHVAGIDPSEEQLAYARTRLASSTLADFRRADAMALPFADGSFDIAVMPLVIFFVPDPPKGVAEFARVLRPGGVAAAYAWDIPGGGFPYDPLWQEMRATGVNVPMPPHPEASSLDALATLWTTAGLQSVRTRTITVRRTYADFEDYWQTAHQGPSVGRGLATMPPDDLAKLKERMRQRLGATTPGPITCEARANAVKGTVGR